MKSNRTREDQFGLALVSLDVCVALHFFTSIAQNVERCAKDPLTHSRMAWFGPPGTAEMLVTSQDAKCAIPRSPNCYDATVVRGYEKQNGKASSVGDAGTTKPSQYAAASLHTGSTGMVS